MNRSLKLSNWFPPTQPPWEPGVYITSTFPGKAFQYWNGTTWGLVATTAENAADPYFTSFPAYYQTLYWRGLSEKPE